MGHHLVQPKSLSPSLSLSTYDVGVFCNTDSLYLKTQLIAGISKVHTNPLVVVY